MDQYQIDIVKRKRDQLALELVVLDAQLKLRDNIAAELEEIEDFLEEAEALAEASA
jgi:chaperonin cofactor prefoldin